MPSRLQPRLALALLTALNFVNYIDRSVLFAVQPLVKQEFHATDANLGFLTTAFFTGYMCTAPFFGFLADRYPRKRLIILGAMIWSGATLLTAITHDFRTLLFRHTVVAIGEASFATIASPFLADLFSEDRRGRVLSVFALANPTGTALGYVLGGAARFRAYIKDAPRIRGSPSPESHGQPLPSPLIAELSRQRERNGLSRQSKDDLPQ